MANSSLSEFFSPIIKEDNHHLLRLFKFLGLSYVIKAIITKIYILKKLSLKNKKLEIIVWFEK